VIDGEAVLGVDGISGFNGLHLRRHDDEVQFYAFDMLASDGEDLRRLPLSMRKTNLARLVGAPRRRHPSGAVRTGRDRSGPVPARCLMGLEGLVSKHRDIAAAGRTAASR
jgi:bifunctional non-homologous end joining protein LigD